MKTCAGLFSKRFGRRTLELKYIYGFLLPGEGTGQWRSRGGGTGISGGEAEPGKETIAVPSSCG